MTQQNRSGRLYVVVCESGHLWLVRASSEVVAREDWRREVARGNAEPLIGVRRPHDRAEINYLREIGQAEA